MTPLRMAMSFLGCHRRGGVERIVFECTRFLASRGHELTVFAGDWETDDRYPVRYRRVALERGPAFWTVRGGRW